MSFATLLGVVFLVLKLTHFIAWSWVWVLAPFWVGVIVWLAAVVFLYGMRRAR